MRLPLAALLAFGLAAPAAAATCDLLPPDAAAALAGAPVTKGQDDATECQYSGTPPLLISLDVTAGLGDNAKPVFEQTFSDKAADISPAPQIGPDAVFKSDPPVLAIFALRDHMIYTLQVLGSAAPDPKAALVTAMRTVLANAGTPKAPPAPPPASSPPP